MPALAAEHRRPQCQPQATWLAKLARVDTGTPRRRYSACAAWGVRRASCTTPGTNYEELNMITTRTKTEERRWQELVDEIAHQLAAIKSQQDYDRVRLLWALKMIAESVAELDQLDRSQGYLPLYIRPSLMLRPNEAAVALHQLRSRTPAPSALSLIARLERYLDGRMREYLN